MDEVNVTLGLTAGASLTTGQILISKDSSCVVCCSGRIVKIFNTTNGQCVHYLQGHTDSVTGISFNPANKFQIFSCGLDGFVKKWDIMDGVLLKTYSFYMPLYGIVSVNAKGNKVTVIARRPQASRCCVIELPLGAGKVKTEALLSCEESHKTVAKGRNGEYIAAVQGHELFVRCCTTKMFKKLTTSKKNPFTCVACHPTDICLAAGHADGKISFWWNFLGKDKVVTSTKHWHSLAVQCLAFSPEGSCLLSGGHECVLVKWQLNSEDKDFFPRLGAPLCNITPSADGSLFVTSHTDNVLQIISSSFQVVHAIRGLAKAHLGADEPKENVVPVGLLCDPRSKALVMNGRPGHLQFYCMKSDCQLYNLDIVGENYVSSGTGKKATVTEVEEAAFDESGRWLATFERWDDGEFTPDYRLKFWKFKDKSQNYQLNTTVETPHYKTIKCLRFKPYPASPADQTPTMVSTGADGSFKVWFLVTETIHGRTVSRWMCESQGTYRNKSSNIARFSKDGSILAVAFDSSLTVWDFNTNTLKGTLCCAQTIKYMEFGGKECSHLIVTVTSSNMLVWNLETYSVHLSIPLNEAVLTTDGDLMAAVTAEQTLYVFRPDKWEPIFEQKKVLKNPVVKAIFLSQPTEGSEDKGELGWQRQSRLYLLDSKQQLFTPQYTSIMQDAEKASTKSHVVLHQTLPETPFMQLVSQTRHQEDAKQQSSAQEASNTRGFQPLSSDYDVMNTRITQFVSFSSILDILNEKYLERRPAELMEVEENDDSDDEMEDDSLEES